MLTPQRRRTVSVIATVVALVALTGYVAATPGGLSAEVRALVGLTGRGGDDTPGAHHAYLQTQPGSASPVGWDPCTPVRYVVNPTDAPADWEDLVTDGIDTIAAATGLTFLDQGTSQDRDFDDREARGATPDPVLIGWADEDEVADLAGDVAGLGGAVSVWDRGRWRYTTGSVVLDTEAFSRLDERRQGREVELAILLHELGHVVGLGHVEDRGELMHADGVPRPGFGPGDLEGLAVLGGLPCR